MIDRVFLERTILNIEYSGDKEIAFCLTNGADNYPLFSSTMWDGKRRAKMLLCIADGTSFLTDGRWFLKADSPVEISEQAIAALDSASVSYEYGGSCSYEVSLGYADGAIYLDTQFNTNGRDPHKRGIKKQALQSLMQAAYNISRLLKRNRRERILLISETRNEMSDNFKALYYRMIERGLDQKYTIDIRLANELKGGTGIGAVLKTTMAIASADTIFVDDYMPVLSYVTPDAAVKLIQLWHAGFGYKLVGYARFGRVGSPHPYQSCHRKYTHAVIGNDHLAEVYEEVFGISRDKMLPVGMPRLERLLDDAENEATRKRLHNMHPELSDKRVIVYAPTYRGNNQAEAHNNTQSDSGEVIDQQALHDMCAKTNSVFIYKYHHFVTDDIEIADDYKTTILNLSDESLNDLMTVADVLITDYSSCFYDFILFNKPIVFYLYDEEEYASTRGVHYPVSETAPGAIVRTCEELLRVLGGGEIEVKTPPAYMIDACATNGNYQASDRIIDTVIA